MVQGKAAVAMEAAVAAAVEAAAAMEAPVETAMEAAAAEALLEAPQPR